MRMRKRERERRVPPVRNGRQYIRRAGPGGYKMASLSGFFGARGSKRAEFTGNERNTNYIFGTESSLSSYSFFSPAPLSLSLSLVAFPRLDFSFYCYLILWEVFSLCNVIRERDKRIQNIEIHTHTKAWKDLQEMFCERESLSFQTERASTCPESHTSPPPPPPSPCLYLSIC